MRSKRKSILDFTAAELERYGGLDNVPVSQNELATCIRVSRRTVGNWIADGYRFEFGHQTMLGHLKAWLRERPIKEAAGIRAALDRLR